MKRFTAFAAAGLFAAVLGAAPVSAQVGGGNGNGNNNPGNNSGGSSCTQTTTGDGGRITGAPQTNRGNGSAAALTGVIDALINANALDNLDVAANALNSSPVQVVCLNDALNQNDLSLLSNVLSGDNILNNSPILNDSLNNLAQNALQNADINAANNVQVLAVSVGGAGTPSQVFLLSR
jgi:hypothetical protein